MKKKKIVNKDHVITDLYEEPWFNHAYKMTEYELEKNTANKISFNSNT